MKKRVLFVVFLFSFLFILGCKTSTITEKKGMLSYSIKGCINKQFIAKRSIEEPITIEATEDLITFQHKANHLCNLDIELQQTIKNAQITVIEVFTGQGARCVCDSEISAIISPLEKGVYNLKIYKKLNDNPPELVKEANIAVGQITTPLIECNDDKDCVPAACCHPTDCVPKSEVPNCKGIFCTTECAPNTLDCNQGRCVCENNQCKALIYS